MQSVWDDRMRRVRMDDGTLLWLTFIRSAEQAERWQAAGYDLRAAALRSQAAGQRRNAASENPASSAMSTHEIEQAYAEAETASAIAEGVPPDDPDLPLIARSVRAWW
jgi:hypothetical protein